MNLMKIFLAIVLLGGSFWQLSCQTNNKPELPETVEQAITMLEAKKYEEFLNRFVHPETKSRILQQQTPEEFMADFGNRRAELLLTALKKTKGKQPQYKNEMSEAVFDDLHPHPPLRFKKLDGIWYLLN